MALKSNEVRVAVTGEVHRGPLGTTAPTGTTGPVPSGQTGLGFVDDGGVTEDPNKSTKVIKAWQKGQTVRTLVTDGTLTYKFRMIQTNKDTTEVYYGSKVTQTEDEGSFVIDPTNTGGRQTWTIDVLDGPNIRRIWIPEGEITDTTAIKYAGTDETGYEVTLTAYYSDSISGNAKTWDTALKSATP